MWSPEPIRFSQAPKAIVLAGTLPEPEPIDEAALEEAYQRGWEEAYARAEEQMLEQRQQFEQFQEGVLRSLSEQHDSLVAQFSAALTPLAGQIAARVLAGCTPDLQVITRVVEETLAEVETGTPEVEVRLAQADFTLAQEIATAQQGRFPGLKMLADESLRPGDCLVQSRFGAIDGRLRTKLENLLSSLS